MGDTTSIFSNSESMNSDKILQAFSLLNEELKKKNVIAHLNVVGDAVMCLIFRNWETTRDIDAIFESKTEVYAASKSVAKRLNLPEDWLNDSVKGFISESAKFILFKDLSNLKIFVASPEYMFAMKMLAARTGDTRDIEDLKELIVALNIREYSQAENIVLKYYPAKLVLPKCSYLIQELLKDVWGNA